MATRRRRNGLSGGGRNHNPDKPRRTTIKFANEEGEPLESKHTFTRSPNEVREALYALISSKSNLEGQLNEVKEIKKLEAHKKPNEAEKLRYNELKQKYAENIDTMPRGWDKSHEELLHHLRKRITTNSNAFDKLLRKTGIVDSNVDLQYNINKQSVEQNFNQDKFSLNPNDLQTAEIKELLQKMNNLERDYKSNIAKVNADTESQIKRNIKFYTWKAKEKTKKIRNRGDIQKESLTRALNNNKRFIQQALNNNKRFIQHILKREQYDKQKREILKKLEEKIHALPDSNETKQPLLEKVKRNKQMLNQLTKEWKERYKHAENEKKRLQKRHQNRG